MRPELKKKSGRWGIYTWNEGFKHNSKRKLSLEEEAKRNPEAVINRLMKEGRFEEAEKFLDLLN